MLRLLDLLFPPRTDETLVRNLTARAFGALVVPTRVPATHPETLTLLPFSNDAVRAVIHEAKYHGNIRAFALLGLVFAGYLKHAYASERVIVIPVPLGEKRRRERGFNQTERIAAHAFRILKRERPALSLDPSFLIRTRETSSQVSLTRAARAENLRGAFTAIRPANPNASYLIIDDVLTTGATLQAAADALRAAGAAQVIPLALAH